MKIGLIFLGAHLFRDFEDRSNQHFLTSKISVEKSLKKCLAAEGRSIQVLDLFNRPGGTDAITTSILSFVENKQITDAFIYYCGHGDFLKDNTSYVLLLKETNKKAIASTSLNIRCLAEDVGSSITTKYYIIIDACYSGAAAKEFLSFSSDGPVQKSIQNAANMYNRVFFASTSSIDYAYAPQCIERTLFSEALVRALDGGIEDVKSEWLSLSELKDEINRIITEISPETRQQSYLYAAHNRRDPTLIPLFRNNAFSVSSKSSGAPDHPENGHQLKLTPPDQRKRFSLQIFIWVTTVMASVIALTIALRLYQRERAELSSCDSYRAAMAKGGRPHAVACNSNTAPGYFWAVAAPRVREYGFWGMTGTGSIPRCSSDDDLESTAEAAGFHTTDRMMEVREYWCRNTSQPIKCTGKQDEGPVFLSNNYHDGVFKVFCRKQ